MRLSSEANKVLGKWKLGRLSCWLTEYPPGPSGVPGSPGPPGLPAYMANKEEHGFNTTFCFWLLSSRRTKENRPKSEIRTIRIFHEVRVEPFEPTFDWAEPKDKRQQLFTIVKTDSNASNLRTMFNNSCFFSLVSLSDEGLISTPKKHTHTDLK